MPDISGTPASPRTFSQAEKNKVTEFFFRLGNVYGAGKISREWPDENALKMAKREHGSEIVRFSDAEIHQAFQRLKAARIRDEGRQLDFPSVPNVLRFAREARLDSLGLPSESSAFQQAIGNCQDRHPAVVFTLRNMGSESFALRRSSQKEAAMLFSKEWDKTIQHVVKGGKLPDIEPQIAERPEASKEATRKAAEKGMELLKGIFE